MSYDPRHLDENIESCNRDLQKKQALGRVEIGLYQARPVMFYDPDKVPEHQAEAMAAAYAVRLGRSLYVIAKPGLFDRQRSRQASAAVADPPSRQ